MKLTKFKLVNHEGLSGLNYKGKTISFDKIDDKLAEELIGKTHVLERLPNTEPAPTSEALVLPEATTSQAPALPEATDGKKKDA
jgi:hypothetical protein